MADSSSAATVSKAEGVNGVNCPKPAKPYEGFPLFPHALGYWAKKIDGQLIRFGRWGRIKNGVMQEAAEPGDGWAAALDNYRQQYAGEAGEPPKLDDRLTVRELCNAFHNAKKDRLESGELRPRTFAEYESTCDRIVEAFGKDRAVEDLTLDDFAAYRKAIAKKWGAVALGNEIQRVRSVFKFAYDSMLIDKPVRYGQSFSKPSKKTMKQEKAGKSKKLFTAEEVRAMIAKAPQPLKAMILLGINCGFGNSDCGRLTKRFLDLKNGWHDFPRPKTGEERRCPLWPETVAAIKEALAERPTPKDEAHKDLVFVTKYGKPWAKDTPDSPVAKETAKLLDEIGAHRAGLGFYTLRHTFRTIADGKLDQAAANYMMGHADRTMAANYRQQIDDERLQAVADHVRAWLWPKGGEQ